MAKRVSTVDRLGMDNRVSILKEAARIDACPKSRRGFSQLRRFAEKKRGVRIDDRMLQDLFSDIGFVREVSQLNHPLRLGAKADIQTLSGNLRRKGCLNGSVPEGFLTVLFDHVFSRHGVAVSFPVLGRLAKDNAKDHILVDQLDDRPRAAQLAGHVC